MGSALQGFGLRIAFSGDHVFVAATGELDRRGVVYVYARDELTGRWRETQRLEPSFRRPTMRFGLGLSADDGRLAVGAPGPSVAADFSGAVFLFEFDAASGLWVEVDVLQEPGTGRYGGLLLDGERLIVIDSQDGGSPLLGRAYFYRIDGTTGRFEPNGSVGSPGPPVANSFPLAFLHLDDDTVLLSDTRATINGIPQAGLVRIVQRQPSTGVWTEIGTLQSPDPARNERFGQSLAWDGEQLLVGEPQDSERAAFGGSVNVFEPDAQGGWNLVQELTPESPPQFGTYFGGIHALSDGELFVGTLDRSGGETTRVVERWLRDQRNRHWRKAGEYRDLSALPSLDFGIEAEVHGGILAVGSTRSDYQEVPGGRAYIYDLAECNLLGSSYCDPATSTSSGQPATLSTFGSGAASDGLLSLRAASLPPNALALVLASRTAGLSLPAASAGPLCLSGSIGRFLPAVEATVEGHITLHLDSASIPTPSGPVAIVPGDTWHFQVWFRDVAASTSANFTNASRIAFQ